MTIRPPPFFERLMLISCEKNFSSCSTSHTCQIIFQRILTAFQKCRIRFSYRYAFEAHMFEYRNILRLGKNLIAYNTTSHGFGFQIADDTVGESLVLEGFLNSDITHNPSAKGTGTYQFTIGKKTHSVFDISCKG